MDKTILEKRIQEVKKATGKGTAMVSLYISSGTNISTERQRMSEEKSEASNIKSKQNRKNVQKAIDRVGDVLKQYRQTPDNGLVLFVGVTEDGTEEFIFDNLPEELEFSDYTCDNRFHTEPLEEMVAPDHRIGLLIIERGGSVIGELRGTSIKVHDFDEDNFVRSKHNAGGFSNRRFDRLIEEEKENYFNSVADKLQDLFVDNDNRPEVDGFVIGGTMFTAREFSNEHLPQTLDEVMIGGVYRVDIANPEGLENLVDQAQEEIESISQQEERENIEKFFRSLNGDNNLNATYGEEQVEKALDYGAVDTILVSQNMDRNEIEEYQESVENQGGDLVVISDDFSEGDQFWKGFNGLGALLRYQIE